MRQLKITRTITNRENASLEKYLQEIGRVQMITPEEEVQLARRIREGDQQALDTLTRANLRFVVSVAKQYQNQGLSLSDLINEGNLGLIKAAKRFDETRGFKFISYAVWWIRQSILQALAEHARIVRLPLNQIGSLSKIARTFARLEQEFEREPSPDEMAQVLEISVEKLEETLNSAIRHVSMDAPLIPSDEGCLIDVLENPNAPKTDVALIRESLQMEIERVLNTLPEREKLILKMFFGIGLPYNMSLDEIAMRFDLTRERVRQLKEKAIRKLRHKSKSRLLIHYLG